MHAKVYALGAKYSIDALQTAAQHKFSDVLEFYMTLTEHPAVITVVYQSMTDPDRGLRDLLEQAIHTNCSMLFKNPQFRQATHQVDGLVMQLVG